MPALTHWQHPAFFAYFPSNTSYPSILGELLAAGLGVQGMSWVTSPACTELELRVVDWMAELLGLPARVRNGPANEGPGAGVIQGSASEATLVAILAARWRATGGAVNRDGDTRRGSSPTPRHRPTRASRRGYGSPVSAPTRCARSPTTSASRCVPDALADGDRRRPGERADPVLRVRHARHDVVERVRSGGRHRGGVRRQRRVAARRRRDERHRRARARAAMGQRRARACRQLLHEPAQVDGHQLRLRPLLHRRSRRVARRAQHPARVPALGGRGTRARRPTCATGRCRSGGVSARSSCGSGCGSTASSRTGR